MAFNLTTGVPGSGKTLYTVDKLKNGSFIPNTDVKRPVYYFGIPDLSPDLGWILLEDPKNWHEEVVDSSIVIIDECQEHFPVRSARNSVPEGLVALERHRHRGLDVYFLTQHPSLLDHHARRLVGEHCHLKRNFGANFSVLYRSNECMGDPQDYHALKKAEKTTFKFPKSTFGLYKSAEIHTHKFRMPKIIYLLLFLILVVFFSVSYFIDNILSSSALSSDEINPPVSSLIPNVLSNKSKQKLTISSFIPAISNTPASSDFYQKGWSPKSVPVLSACIGSGSLADCFCYTQQGTRIVVSQSYCLLILSQGSIYDHTLKDNRFNKKQVSLE